MMEVCEQVQAEYTLNILRARAATERSVNGPLTVSVHRNTNRDVCLEFN